MTSRVFDIIVNVVTSNAARQLDNVKNKLNETGKAAEKAKKGTDGTSDSMASAAKIGATLGKGLAGVATAMAGLATAAAYSAQATAILVKEQSVLAERAGTNLQTFQALAYATEQYGVKGDKLADIVKDLNDKLGDFTVTGGGEFQEFFKRLGDQTDLTATKLAALAGPDQIQAVMKALNDANVPMAEQIKLLEGIAGDLSTLTPLYKENAKEVERLKNEFIGLGAQVNSFDAEKLKEFEQATRKLGLAWQGLQNQLDAFTAEALTPIVELATKLLTVSAGKFDLFVRQFDNAPTAAAKLDILTKAIEDNAAARAKAEDDLANVGTGRDAASATARIRDELKELEKQKKFLEEQKAATQTTAATESKKISDDAKASGERLTGILKDQNALINAQVGSLNALENAAKKGTAAYDALLAKQKVEADLLKYRQQLLKEQPVLAQPENAAAVNQLVAAEKTRLELASKVEAQLKSTTEAEEASADATKENAAAKEQSAKAAADLLASQEGYLQSLRNQVTLEQAVNEEQRQRIAYGQEIADQKLTNDQQKEAVRLNEELIKAQSSTRGRDIIRSKEEELILLRQTSEETRKRLELELQLQSQNLSEVDQQRVRILNEQIALQEEKNRMLAQEKDAITALAKGMGQWASGSKEAIRTVIAELIRLVAIRSGFGNNPFIGGFLSGIGSVKGYAAGGTFNAGETFMVGEKGPELITSNAAGTVIPNHQLSNQSKGFNQNISLSINGSVIATEELDKKFQEFAVAVSKNTQNLLRNQMRTGGSLNYAYS